MRVGRAEHQILYALEAQDEIGFHAPLLKPGSRGDPIRTTGDVDARGVLMPSGGRPPGARPW